MKLRHIFLPLILSAVNLFASEPLIPGGLVRLSVVPMRARPSHASEQVSQALMGTPLLIIDHGEDWTLVQTPDGYQGYIINHSIEFMDETEMLRWQQSDRLMVTSPYELRVSSASGAIVTDLVAGCIIEQLPDGMARTPDGRRFRRPVDVAPIRKLADAPINRSVLPQYAALYMGTPYLWGGLSSKGMDCSGLVRMAYMAQGRLLPRDAKDQALEGTEVHPDSLQPGDLVFFGNPDTQRINHVGIYAGDGDMVHASQLVRRNSLIPAASDYYPNQILSRRRIEGEPLTISEFYFPAIDGGE